ncbi:DnaJ domain-containing protein [Schinkia azotoformans]|uniref:DnaJ domain-containing protein n=1 Tax=Schinkia azotoformans TaxID=1454 RepID=UPI002DB97C53|nr:DnaJ domain-containing protein [Schinkia azotoformans]MEC1757396.1 DnaJ domain-containing protein [Schinkia azotoformans]
MDTQQAFEKLKQAGITDSIQTVRRWLRNGTIKASRTDNRKAGFLIDEQDLQRFINDRTGADKDEQIKKLKQHIEDIEHFHENGSKVMKNRYWQLEKENERLSKLIKSNNQELKTENQNLKDEIKKLRKEKMDLLNEKLELLDRISNIKKGNPKWQDDNSFEGFWKYFNVVNKVDYRQKLGLSPNCSNDEVKKEYKKLIMILHPDKGGNAKIFQQIKNEYDEFRKSI